MGEESYLGRLDTFWLIFTLADLACLNTPVLKWALPIVCFAAMATHPGYEYIGSPSDTENYSFFREFYRNRIPGWIP